MTTIWEWFDGETFDAERDRDRLAAQLGRVRAYLSDGAWHTLAEIATATGDPEASISARIRDLRKRRHGSRIVEREYLEHGLWRYRLLPLT